MSFWKSILFLSITIGIISILVRTIINAGEFKEILNSHLPSECTRVMKSVEGLKLVGIEDMVNVPLVNEALSEYLILTSDDKTFFRLKENDYDKFSKIGPNEQGNLFLLNMKNNEISMINLLDFKKLDFHPHGIGITSDGAKLFVVNHGRFGDSVDVFELSVNSKEARFVFEVSVAKYPILRNLNDVQAYSATSFYVTVWEYYRNTDYLYMFEKATQQAWGYVVFCYDIGTDTEACEIVTSGISMANGIGLSSDKSKLFVSETLKSNLLVYQVGSSGFKLTEFNKIYLDFGVDNLQVLGYSVLVAGHPQMFRFLSHQTDFSKNTPSQATLVAFSDDFTTFSAKSVYHSIGNSSSMHDIPASSIAIKSVQYHKLFLGSVFVEGVLVCHD